MPKRPRRAVAQHNRCLFLTRIIVQVEQRHAGGFTLSTVIQETQADKLERKVFNATLGSLPSSNWKEVLVSESSHRKFSSDSPGKEAGPSTHTAWAASQSHSCFPLQEDSGITVQ